MSRCLDTHSSRRQCSRWAAPPRWTKGSAVEVISPLLLWCRWLPWRWWRCRWCLCRNNTQPLQEGDEKHIIQHPTLLLKTSFSLTQSDAQLTFFVSRFRWQQKGGVLIGCCTGHSVSRHGKSRLRDEPRHQGNEPAAFNRPF